VVRWLKSAGEAVVKGEPLVEVETDKVTVDVEAPVDGILAGVSASEGDDVPVGQSVAVILALGESAAEPETRAAPQPAEIRVAHTAGDGAQAPARREVEERRRPLASPKARRLATERGIDVAAILGSGPHGAVVAADVQSFAGAERAVPDRPSDVLPVGSIWRRMAERLTESWQTVPHFYLERDVDAGRLESWRASVRGRAGYDGLTHTDLLIKIAAAALREHPRVNASWRDGAIEEHADVNVGVAVAVEDGLVVPVVQNADRLPLRDIAARRAELVAAAREGRLRPDDVARGTFTISNLGMFRVDAFTAIVNAPQAAILAVGRVSDRIVPADGRPAVRPIVALTLSFDHRVVDGARGAQFLDTLASFIEEPAALVS
ncbi:MAG: 2-oxo acid dehydrogenase subunit E2, partial [Thermoleophilia bacterium]|nr:2-oxo acid dehydrogenase subunit E2 [Thermoleophilia bacterium]